VSSEHEEAENDNGKDAVKDKEAGNEKLSDADSDVQII
jgi:hypothetical protein